MSSDNRNPDYSTGTNTNNTENPHTMPGAHDRALIDKLKDALRPADARRPPVVDTTHDGRHGAIEEVMEPAHRDYHDDVGGSAGAPRRRSSLDDGLDGATRRRRSSGGSASSILERLYFRQQQHQHQQQQQPQPPGVGGSSKEEQEEGGGVVVKKKGRERYRDATDAELLGDFYQTIRDDFGG